MGVLSVTAIFTYCQWQKPARRPRFPTSALPCHCPCPCPAPARPCPVPAASAHLQPALGGASPRHGGGVSLPPRSARGHRQVLGRGLAQSLGKNPRQRAPGRDAGKEPRAGSGRSARPVLPVTRQRPRQRSPSLAGNRLMLLLRHFLSRAKAALPGFIIDAPALPGLIIDVIILQIIGSLYCKLPCSHEEHIHVSMTLVPGLAHVCQTPLLQSGNCPKPSYLGRERFP